MAQTNGKKNGGKKTANLVSDGVVKMTAEIETPETPETVETPKAASRGHYAAAVVYSLTADQIAEAIADGRIANVGTTDVTISAKVTKTKDESITYEKLIALTADGQAFLCGGKMEPATDAPESGKDERTDEQKAKGACDHFNYGFDLEVKRSLRSKLAELIEGPAKAIAKAAQVMLDNGMADSLDEAVAMVKASRAKKGLPV